MSKSFTHLHVHTHYSMLDGACKVPNLVKRVKELGMNSVAISDHGCMYGAIEFYNECKKEGIKPIIGLESYMAPGDRRDRQQVNGETAFHLLLLAQNLEGYKNLIKLSSLSYREGFYYKPRIDKEILREYSKGIIATSACLGGEVASAFMKRDMKAAKEVAETYLDIFGPDRFFIEVQKHIKEQDQVNPELADLAKRIGVGLVGTNDVHFLNQDDHSAHDVLCCISMGRLVSDENRLKYPTELYLKSPDEMQKALGSFDGAIDNTQRIADMCNLELDFSKRYAPVYRVPTEKLRGTAVSVVSSANEDHGRDAHATMKDDERYLRQLCEDGLLWRYGTTEVSEAVRQRLEYELSVIVKKSFCSYFLIVWDFCNFARDNGIPVGARGSGVGTMVGYLLGLCNVDPIKYGLLFERFMDPSRNEMPDIDIDICQDGRQKVIEYVRNKYGHVAQIITFGTLAAKAACKDVGRVLGVPLADIDKLTKLIPTIPPGIKLQQAMDRVPELASMYQSDPQAKKVIDLALKLEGLCRNAGVHAAGVIIADQPLDDVIPLCKDKEDNVLTQFEGPISEKCGLLKMDFLGLRTLTTITRAIELECATQGQRALRWSPNQPTPPLDAKNCIDIEKIDLADKTVLALFSRGETRGIFQFESGGMQDLLMKMVPDRIEDLIAANALYRPGPMELIPTYCNRKHGREAVPKVHPIMDAILEETYGIMVYQEQVMQIFNQLGGIELSNAYKLIKAISKKQSDVIAKFKPEFLKGTMEKGVGKEKATEIFDHILKFGGYGFNKSHSTRYAIVAFQTAYMKIYHPVEYMSALLTFEMGDATKMVEYFDECRRIPLPDGTKGIDVLPPDVNESNKDFTPVYVPQEVKAGKGKKAERRKRGLIRFGLNAIRGVGEKAVESVIEERVRKGAFSNVYEFCDRNDLRVVQKSTVDALAKCGAFASTGAKRSQLLFVLEKAYEMGQQAQADRKNGQLNMFAAASSTATTAPVNGVLPDVAEIPNADLLKYEKEYLGFYITSHPLTQHQVAIERYTTATTKEAMSFGEGTEVTIGGMLSSVKSKVAKSGRSAGQRWAIIEIEDIEGKIEGMLFSEAFGDLTTKFPNLIKAEQIVFVKGKIDRKRETPCLVVNDVIGMDDAPARLTTAAALRLDRTKHTAEALAQVAPILKQHKGSIDLFVQVETADERKVVLKLNKAFNIRPSQELVEEVDRILGNGTVQLFGLGQRRLKRIEQQRLFAERSETAEIKVDDEAAAMEQIEEELLAVD